MVNASLESVISNVKIIKAEKSFESAVAVYGSVANALKSYDCSDRHEAISMLARTQHVRVHKINGIVVVE